jgi:PIN domain nuclease of toxin-antitoxin system
LTVKALIDSHAFLWAVTDDPRLSERARELMLNAEHEILLSAVSAYELAWKAINGGLSLPDEPRRWIATRTQAFGIRELPVTAEHAAEAAGLPPIHRDPWDRILVAQARIEGVPLVTIDTRIRRYDVETIW